MKKSADAGKRSTSSRTPETASRSGVRSRKDAPAARARARAKAPRRADFGAPVDGFFAKQPPHLRAVLDALRTMVEDAAPDAVASIKWGMPFYALDGEMMCALGAHRSHVNLILSGPPDAFPDPQGRLAGEGKTGRHLALRGLDELPAAAVRRWLRIAAGLARERAAS